ncbi:MAG: phosphatase PAP2 family protein [Eudoraea sp.]|nr:phosphatase PAP2 family protein [Eudoraea sp.]
MLKRILEWDRQTFIYLNSLGIEQYDTFWSVVTNITTWIPLYLLFFILLQIKYPRKEAVIMTMVTLVALGAIILTMDITKEAVARLRPNNNVEINTLIRILKSPTNYSFFSGHAASSFGMTTLIVLFLRNRTKWVWVFFIWPFLFAFSRIYVGVHYPIDIIVGALIGGLYALLFYRMYDSIILPKIRSARP